MKLKRKKEDRTIPHGMITGFKTSRGCGVTSRAVGWKEGRDG